MQGALSVAVRSLTAACSAGWAQLGTGLHTEVDQNLHLIFPPNPFLHAECRVGPISDIDVMLDSRSCVAQGSRIMFSRTCDVWTAQRGSVCSCQQKLSLGAPAAIVGSPCWAGGQSVLLRLQSRGRGAWEVIFLDRQRTGPLQHRCGAMTPCDAIESSFWCIGVGDVCAEHSRRALGSAILTAGGLLLPYGPPGGLWGLPSGRCKRQRHLQRAGDPPCTGSSAAAARVLAGAAASHLPLLRSVLGLYVVSNSVGTLLCSTHSAQGSRSNLWRAAHLWRVWTRCRCLLRAAGTQAAARTMDLHHRLRRDPSW